MSEKSLVLCPVYNEENTVATFFEHVKGHHDGHILFVDDGSTDDSRKFLEQYTDQSTFLLRHSTRQGYGRSLVSGFSFALKNGYKKVVTLDVDLQHNPAHIPTFLKQLETYEVVLGSRYLRENDHGTTPPDRLVINRNIVGIINALFSVEFTDPFCGFRAYRDSFLKKAHLQEDSYGLAIELLIEIIHTETTFTELPVEAIYFDNNRAFLDGLDDPQVRFSYYLQVIERKLDEIKHEKDIPHHKPAS